jgi:D-aspartate ligase
VVDFDVLIIGTDANAYYMARNFHEAYNIKPHLIGKVAMNFTRTSSILTYEIEPHLWDANVFIEKLEKYAIEHRGKPIILVGTNDTYVRLIAKHATLLKKYYLFNYSDLKIIDSLMNKQKFYTIYQDSGLDMPRTYIYSCKKHDLRVEEIRKLAFPVILKPADTIKYHEHEFPGQAKVYKLNNEQAVCDVIKQIEQTGYNGDIIIQEFIPGDDSLLFDSIVYFSSNGDPQLMSFAQIGLQEHTPTGIGNCTVLINGYSQYSVPKHVKEKMIQFLKKIKYRGIAEFDLKYDVRNQRFKVLEINPRQARCGYYLTACGYNLAKYLVDDLLYHKMPPFQFIDNVKSLSFVPKSVIKRYVTNDTYRKKILNLWRQKDVVNPLRYERDAGIKRRLWLMVHDVNYAIKYKRNTW